MSLFTRILIHDKDNSTRIYYDLINHKILGYKRPEKKGILDKVVICIIILIFTARPTKEIIITPLIQRPDFWQLATIYIFITVVLAFMFNLFLNTYLARCGKIDKEFDDNDLEESFIKMWTDFKKPSPVADTFFGKLLSPPIKTSIYSKLFPKKYFQRCIKTIIMEYSLSLLLLYGTVFTSDFSVRYITIVIATIILPVSHATVALTFFKYLIYKNMKKTRLK